MKRACRAASLVLLLSVTPGAPAAPASPDVRLAQLPLPTGPGADWRQWDSFLTDVIKKLAADLGDTRRDQLRDLFLDARYQLVQTLSSGVADPVPSLFLDSWNRLSPILKQVAPGLSPELAGRYASFTSTLDAAASLGQRFGILQISPDMLRSASALLGTGNADPLAYVLDVDSELRTFLGLTDTLPTPRLSPHLEQGSSRPLDPRGASRAARTRGLWFVRPAFAEDNEFERLNQWVPQTPELNEYLSEVRRLLTQASVTALGKSKLPAQYRTLFRQIVFSAAWQESCWRQFVRKGEKLAPLASSTGDVGMMQINRYTWRGLYDLNGLSGDIEYNSRAGSEILLYYLSRYAIPRREDKQPGGQLARATYSAYNGGPRALSRYRTPATVPALKKVDEAFWAKFRAVASGQELAVRSCFGS
jgi:Transglycosylase SLT domain